MKKHLQFHLSILFLFVLTNSFAQFEVSPTGWKEEKTEKFVQVRISCDNNQNKLKISVRKHEGTYSNPNEDEWDFKCDCYLRLHRNIGGDNWVEVGDSKYFSGCEQHERSYYIPYSKIQEGIYRVKFYTPSSSSNCYGTSCSKQKWFIGNFQINKISQPDAGDIYTSSESIDPTEVSPNETVRLSCKQYFDGTASKDYRIYVGYYLSKNKTYSSDDVFLGSDVSTIGKDVYDNESEDVTIPSNTTPGNYYILFCADYKDDFSETNENNNVTAKSITIKDNTPVSTITQPNGGETFTVGDNISIKYTTNYSENITLQLYSKSSSSVVHTFVSNTKNTGSYSTTIPSVSAGDYKIKIYRSGGNNDAVDYSDDYFTINERPKGLTVLSPNGGEIYKAGDLINIRYKKENVPGNIALQLVDKDDNVVETITDSESSEDNYEWQIPISIKQGEYKIKLYDIESTLFVDFSDNVFTIQGVSITVKKPNGGEVFTVNDIMHITYDAENFNENVSLQIVDAKTNVKVKSIVSNTPFTKKYDWTIPKDFPPGNYKVKIYNSKNDVFKIFDLSDRFFTINGIGCKVTNPSPQEQEYYDACCYLMEHGIIDTREDVQPDMKIIRQDVAKIIYLSVYGEVFSVADNFSTLFQDLLLASSEYHKYAISLSYLEFGDGKAPFDRDFINFNPGALIKRKYYVKALLEAFNIKPSNDTNNPFSDVDTDDELYPLLKKAYELRITKKTKFRPNDNIRRIEAFLMLYRILNNSEINKPSEEELTDTANYFVPVNYTQLNYNGNKGLLQGVFQSYSKNAFSLNDIGFNLSFGIFYNSYKFELPKELYLINSLTDGWSHTYDMQIVEADGKGYMSVPYEGGKLYVKPKYRCLVLPDGSVNMFYEMDNGEMYPISKGITSTLEKKGNKYKLTTKHKTVFTFDYKIKNKYNDPVYMLSSITNRNGNKIEINYDVNNPKLISQVKSQSGRTLIFSYNNDKLVKVTDNSLGRDIKISYQNDNVSEFTDAEGNTTKYEYDQTGKPHTQHLLQTVHLPRGNKITVDYKDRKVKAVETSEDMVIKLDVKPLKNKTSYTITHADKEITKDVTFTEKQSPDKISGLVSGVSGNGEDTKITYYDDELKSTLPKSIISNGVEMKPKYDKELNLISRTIKAGGKSISETFDYDDTFNLLISYTDGNGNTTKIKRDSKGNAELITDARGKNTTITYNDWGLPEFVTNPKGIKVEYTYNKYGNVEKVDAPLGISTGFKYDDASRLKAVTIAGKTTKYDYDNVDNLIKTTDALGNATEYKYDKNYNIEKIINAKGKATVLTYDNYDLLKSVTFEGSTEKYSYYDDGAFKTLTKPSGNKLTNKYDKRGRLISNGYITNSTYYEEGTHANKLKSVSNKNGTLTYNYDDFGRLSDYTDYFGNKVGYKYDNVGNITKLIYPDNKTVTYTYNANNQLKTVTADWLSNNKTIITYDYRDDGLLKKETTANGIITTYYYDDAGRLKKKEIDKSGEVLQSWTYAWDLSGNMTKEKASKNLFSKYPDIKSNKLQYKYNSANRIENISGDENISFAFDKDGNCIEKNDQNKAKETYSYDINDRLTDIKGKSFDATYEYDAFGMRRKAIRNGKESRYVLDIAGMEDVIVETDANNKAKWYYIQGLGMAARISPSGEVQYYHHDYRGSTIALTNADKDITHKYSYDIFGSVLQSDEADDNEFRYIGRYGVSYETEDLQFMRARFADNKIGRFLSEDPIWSTNLYPYANNNPIKFIDPKGLYSGDALVCAGVVNNPNFITKTDEFQICKNYQYIGGDSDLGNAIRHSCLTDDVPPAALFSELIPNPQNGSWGFWITKDSRVDQLNNFVGDPLNHLSELYIVRNDKIIHVDYQAIIEYKIKQEIKDKNKQKYLVKILTKKINKLFASKKYLNLSINLKMKALYIALEKNAWKFR